MNQRNYILNDINRAALNENLAQTLGAAYGGFADRQSPQGFAVTVYLNNEPNQTQINQLDNLMASHDPQQLTEEQQARQERQQKLAALRESNDSDLDPADYSGQNALIRGLAQKLAWLEQEVIALGGGGDES